MNSQLPDLTSSSFPSGSFSFIEDLGAADIDHDGDTDLLVADSSDLTWHENLDGAFDFSGAEYPLAPGNFRAVKVADLDADGDLDVVAGGTAGLAAILIWLENDGTPRDGGWTSHPLAVPYEQTMAIDVADLNLDGHLDIVSGAGSNCGAGGGAMQVPICDPSAIVWFAGGPAGTFTVQPEVSLYRGVQSVDVVTHLERYFSTLDPMLEDDAYPDLLVGSDNLVHLYPSELDQGGSFGPPQQQFLETMDFPSESVVAEDVNFDDSPEFFFTASGNFEAYAGCGLGLGNTGCTGVPTIDLPRDQTFADLDSDGDRDWLIATLQGIAQISNDLAQYDHFGVLTLGEPQVFDGQLAAIHPLSVRMGSRPGDPTARLETFGLMLQDGDDLGELSQAELDALIDSLQVYRDNGDNVFDPGVDPLLQTIDDPQLDSRSVVSIDLPIDEPNGLIAAPAGFWVAAQFKADASQQTPSRIATSQSARSMAVKDGARREHPARRSGLEHGFATGDRQPRFDGRQLCRRAQTVASRCQLRGGRRRLHASRGRRDGGVRQLRTHRAGAGCLHARRSGRGRRLVSLGGPRLLPQRQRDDRRRGARADDDPRRRSGPRCSRS